MPELPYIYRVTPNDIALLREDRAHLSYLCELCGHERYGPRPLYNENVCRACVRLIAEHPKHEHHYLRHRAILLTDVYRVDRKETHHD